MYHYFSPSLTSADVGLNSMPSVPTAQFAPHYAATIAVPSLAACSRAWPRGFFRTCQERALTFGGPFATRLAFREERMSGIRMSTNMKLIHIAAIAGVGAFFCAT